MKKLIGIAWSLLGVAVICAGLWHILFTEGVSVIGCFGYIVIGVLLIIGGYGNINGNVSWDD